MLIAATILTAGAILFTLWVRSKDVPAPEPETPTAHLEARKARIYEGLRDLQFEFRVGKLSEEDYERTKTGLQTELAKVLAELDAFQSSTPTAAPQPAPPAAALFKRCPYCGATFPQPLKFCGECGRPMRGDAQ